MMKSCNFQLFIIFKLFLTFHVWTKTCQSISKMNFRTFCLFSKSIFNCSIYLVNWTHYTNPIGLFFIGRPKVYYQFEWIISISESYGSRKILRNSACRGHEWKENEILWWIMYRIIRIEIGKSQRHCTYHHLHNTANVFFFFVIISNFRAKKKKRKN